MKLPVFILLWLSMAGCSLIPTRTSKSPTATINLPSGGGFTQTGDAQKPASVATTVTTSSLPVPAASSVTLDEKKPGILTFQLAAQSELKTETRTEKAEAPQAFTPPAPPSPKDEAAGKLKLWLGIGSVVGLAAGLFGLVRGWNFVMIGGGAVSAACLFGIFVEAHPALFAVIGIGAALAAVGPVIWHTVHKDNPLVNPPPA